MGMQCFAKRMKALIIISYILNCSNRQSPPRVHLKIYFYSGIVLYTEIQAWNYMLPRELVITIIPKFFLEK